MKITKKIISVLIIIALALTLALSLRKKEESKNEITCFISVSCEALTDNLSKLSENKRSLVPENGFLLFKKEVTVNDGENVFNLLSETLKKEKIHITLQCATDEIYSNVCDYVLNVDKMHLIISKILYKNNCFIICKIVVYIGLIIFVNLCIFIIFHCISTGIY